MSGQKPMRVWKIRYFEDPNFRRRIEAVPALPRKPPYPYRPKARPNPWEGRTLAAQSSTAPTPAAGASTSRPNAKPADPQEFQRDMPWVKAEDSARDAGLEPPEDFMPEVPHEAALEQALEEDEDPKSLARRAVLDREGDRHRGRGGRGQMGLGL